MNYKTVPDNHSEPDGNGRAVRVPHDLRYDCARNHDFRSRRRKSLVNNVACLMEHPRADLFLMLENLSRELTFSPGKLSWWAFRTRKAVESFQ